MRKRRDNRQPREFEEKVVDIARVTRVVKGGRRMRFRALVVIGDKKGRVGAATAKAGEVPVAIGKAVQAAKKKMITVPVTESGSIIHDVEGRHGASHVKLLPANEGTSLVSGGSVRTVLEMAGYRNVVSKSIGSNNKINAINATLNALEKLTIKK